MLKLATGTYGTLQDLAPELGLVPGTLKVARHRNTATFPAPVGTIGGRQVYDLADITEWHAKHATVGRPARD